ncbi:hypothetical protein N7516_005768 [Penicillium verrucosum]|uniref:uncharacterized protein n=1 Tax=Penicillium verrucosum TaxID=60171 RepID=UPI002544EAE8|nr:uncharacterized protein N7516_005768 [Penicillium verrucosum]KAJ5931279.1 hypothetical protein N7516_005768 [Penicillium verrucosum]
MSMAYQNSQTRDWAPDRPLSWYRPEDWPGRRWLWKSRSRKPEEVRVGPHKWASPTVPTHRDTGKRHGDKVSVSGAPLTIPFDRLFLRPPQSPPREGDLIIGSEEIEEIAKLVWEAFTIMMSLSPSVR